VPNVTASSQDDGHHATLARWLRPDGAVVAVDDPICELETENASVRVPAPLSGVLRQLAPTGAVVTPAMQIARIDPLP